MTDAAPVEPLAVSVPKAAEITSLSRATIYKMISTGQIPKRKIGHRTVILVSDLRRMLENAPAD